MRLILADESVNFKVITALRDKGYKVDAVIEETPSVKDTVVLQLAHTKEALLLTYDKDFGELTFKDKVLNFGIILLRCTEAPVIKQINLILKLLDEYGDDLSFKFTVLTSDNNIRIRDLT